MAYSPQWVGVSDSEPTEPNFGSTKGLGSPIVIDQRTNTPFFYKQSTGPKPLNFGDYRAVGTSQAVLETDSALKATASGLTLTVPDASLFPDGHLLHFFLGVAGTLTITFAAGDAVLGS